MTIERLDEAGLEAWWKQQQHADAKEWTRISAEVGEWVRELAARDDLVANVGPGKGMGAPAVFLPEIAEVEVDSDTCATGIDPADICMASNAGRQRHAPMAGASAHEGGHGWASTWELDQDPHKRAVVQAALLLEESRMEKHLLKRDASVRLYLRAALSELVAKDADTSTPLGAASALALIAARADAGVITAHEAAPVLVAAADALGADRVQQLRAIWLEAHALPLHTTAEVMEALGQRWLDVLGKDAQGGSGDGGAGDRIACGGHGESQDGQGQGGIAQSIAAAVSADAEEEAERTISAAEARDIAEQADREAKEQRKDEDAAPLMHQEPKGSGHGYSYGYGEGLLNEREPSGAERAQANILASRLRQAQYRDRTTTTVASELPPGRLRSAQAVQRAAQRAQGIPPTAAPFRRVQHRVVEQPPITVAVGCDISGSMRSVTGAVASAAWVIANAVQQVDGTTATAAFGERVHPVVRPGEVPRKVREFNASGGMENITDTLRAFNGSMNLINGKGLRIVIIVSDGVWTSEQRRQGDKLALRLAAAGVRILHLGWRGKGSDVPLAGSTYVQLNDPNDFGRVVGEAMVDLLTAA